MYFALAAVSAAASMPVFSAETGLCVKNANLTVNVVGRYAEQTLILMVENPTETERQDHITLPLPDGRELLGFSVEDAHGQTKEAVCIADAPLEINEGYSLSTQKSPENHPMVVSVPISVAPHEKHCVLFHYAEPLKASDRGDFIFRPHCSLNKQGVRLSVRWQLPLLPSAHETSGEKTSFTQHGSFYVGHEVLSGDQLQQGTCITLPNSLPQESIEVADGIFYTTVFPHSPAPRNIQLPTPEVLPLVWDASASMVPEGNSAAINFLREYLKQAPHIKRVKLAVLRHRAEETKEFSVEEDGGKTLTEYLATLKCDGATADLAEAVNALQPQDFCLIYSDGVSNFGTAHHLNVNCRVTVLSPTDHAGGLTPTLARLNAEVIYLQRGTTEEQVNTLRLLPWSISRILLDGKEWSGAVYDPMQTTFETPFEVIGTIPQGKHCVEIEWESGNEHQTSRYEISTEGASEGILLRSRYAHLLARRTSLETSPLLRQSALKSLSCLYKTAVPGYRLALSSDDIASTEVQYTTVKNTVDKWRRLRTGKAPVLWLKRTAEDMVKQGMKVLSHREEHPEEATGKMPEWLKEDGESIPKKGEVRKRKFIGEETTSHLREHLVPWNPNVSYLKALQTAKDPHATYEKLRKENLRCPTFYAECSYFFAMCGEKEKALSVLSNLCELAPDNLSLQSSLAIRLMLLEEYDLSESCLLKILEKKEDTKQAYWMWALLEERRGNTENAAEILVRLLQFSEIDEGLTEATLVSLNRLRINAERKGKPLKDGLIPQEWIIPVNADLRMELLWDSFDSDVDLKVCDPTGGACDPEHPATITGGIHSPDTTLGLGIESFTAQKSQSGEYAVSANIYGPADQKRFLPITLYLLIYFNYAKEGETCSAHVFRLEQSNGSADLGIYVPGGKFRYSSEAE